MKKLLVVLLVLGLAAPAMATDFYTYGSLRTHLGYYDVSEDYSGGPAMDPSIRGGNAGDSDDGLLLSIGGQSRFGAKFVLSDVISGVTEFGLRENGGDSVYLRMLMASWNFGAGKLTVGKTYTPATFLGYSSMIGDIGDNGDANMLVGGLAYIGRQPLIQLTFGGLEIAAIEPNVDLGGITVPAAAGSPAGTPAIFSFSDVDFTLPRLEAAYVFRTPVVALRPVVGFQTYDVENAAGSESVDSYLAGLGVSLTLGPAYIKATASYVQNPGDYGNTNLIVPAIRFASFNSTGGIEDATLLQGTFVVGMKINPSFGIEAGLGYGKAEIDDAAFVVPGTGTLGFSNQEQEGFLFYLQAPITVAKGMTIIPEVGYLDRDKIEFDTALPVVGNEIEQGDLTYFDVNFRVDF